MLILSRPSFTCVFVGLSIVLIALPASAAIFASYGQTDQTVDACLLNLTQDNVRMFWRGVNGSVFGNFSRLNASLLASNERLVCATNAGIYGADLRPIGL